MPLFTITASPYLLISLSIVLAVAYLLGLLLVKLGGVPMPTHRKFWNLVLLLTFVVTAVLGLLLVIRVSYKIEGPHIKSIIGWYVNFGIAMSIVAAIHAIWHWDYYAKFFRVKRVVPIGEPETINGKKWGLLAILSGFMATTIQVLLLREITTVFQGNELTMGWTLGAWMLLTGAGAYLGRRLTSTEKLFRRLKQIILIQCFAAALLAFSMGWLKNQFFAVGVQIDPLIFLLVILLFLSPICLLSGISFPILVNFSGHSGKGFVGVYALEAVGSLVGGIIVSFLFIQWLSIFQSLLVLTLVAVFTLYYTDRQRAMLLPVGLSLVALAIAIALPVDRAIKSLLFPNQRVLETRETRYGNLTITENTGQLNFYENGSLLFSTQNTAMSEETVHFPMLQHPSPENILLVTSGGFELVNQIFKYQSVKSIDYIDINPVLVGIAGQYVNLPPDSRLQVASVDGRSYIQRNQKKYDVAVFALPDPSSLVINRYYTREFVASIKKRLNPGAVVSYSISPSGNYLSPEKQVVHSAIYNTLKEQFRHVEVIVGEKDYLLASDTSIDLAIARIASTRGVDNTYVNEYYIDDYVIRERNHFVKSHIDTNVQVNTDAKPSPVFFEMLRYLSLFTPRHWYIVAIPIALLLLPVFLMANASRSMYIAGFSGASIELVIIFSFQVFFGYVYAAIGFIVAIFMGGLTLGSLLATRLHRFEQQLWMPQALLGVFSLALPTLWNLHAMGFSSGGILVLVFAMTLIPSSVVGYQYVAATQMLATGKNSSASRVYAADLLGSALGVIAITSILVPLLGVHRSCYFIAGINLIGLVITLFPRRNNCYF
jgi:spermidine synthase